MEIQGHVQNGVIVLGGDFALPEGAVVAVSYPSPVSAKPSDDGERIQLPLANFQQAGSIHLTSQRIAEIFNAEYAASCSNYSND